MKKEVKLIIAGGRNFNNYNIIEQKVLSFMEENKISEIISGGAPGVDKLGELFAEKHFIPLRVFPADWKNLGRSAGPIRNKEMADYGTHLVAFWDGQSRGTKNMIEVARKNGLNIVIVHLD